MEEGNAGGAVLRNITTHLSVRDGHHVLEDDPLDRLVAGRRGQRAVVDEVFLCGVRQEAQRGEGRNLGTLSWTVRDNFNEHSGRREKKR